MAKVLLIQPPQWYPVSPYLALPLLAGQLKRAGFETTVFDLNVKFFNDILTEKHLSESDKKAKRILFEFEPLFENADVSQLRKYGTYEEKTQYLKYTTIKDFYDGYSDEIPYVISNIEWAVNVTRNSQEFFVPEKLFEAKHIMRLATRLASMPYAPNELDLDNYFSNPLLNLDWQNIRLQIKDKSVNMFDEYFDAYVSEVAKENFDVIALSMTDLSQVIPVFTLAKKLKESTDARIVLGGNYSTQIYDRIMAYTDVFSEYIDYLVIGDGEIALVKLCHYIEGKAELKSVPNLVFLNSGGQVESAGFSCEKINMNDVAYPDFSDYDFSKYFSPEPTIPVQLSKGCYWGKCSFCDYPYGQQGYSPKNIERIIKELKYMMATYGATKFMFVDEAIPPAFYNKLALAIIKEGLKINFYSFARLDNGYTPEVLKNLYDAGARLFLWGYECHSERIMALMNKGIDVSKRLSILSDARDAGIWNNGLFMFGYPTETLEETKDTIEVIRENREIIPSCTLSNFSLKKNSALIKNIGENGVEGYSEAGEFYTVYKDVIDGISQADRREIRRSFQFEFLNENENSLWPVVFSDFDHLLLYLSRFGCEYVSSYRSEKRICPEFR